MLVAGTTFTVTITVKAGSSTPTTYDLITPSKVRSNTAMPVHGTAPTADTAGSYDIEITTPVEGLYKLEVYATDNLLGEAYFNVVPESTTANMTVG